MAKALELFAGNPIALLGLVAEREEGFVAASFGARTCYGQDLFVCHERTLALLWGLRERAVVAHVAAEHRQGDEDLRRVRDQRAVAGPAELACLSKQVGQRSIEQRAGFVSRERHVTGHPRRTAPGAQR